MSLRLYIDVHVPRAITDALKLREIDVLTADEDGSRRLTDPEPLDRATALARVLFEYGLTVLARNGFNRSPFTESRS